MARQESHRGGGLLKSAPLGTKSLRLDRREVLAGIGLSAAAASCPSLFATPAVAAPDTAPPDLAKAREEGPLVVWHGDQEPDVVKFLQIFTEKTGIEAEQQRLLPGAALPKLMAELRAGVTDVDVYDTSDAGLMDGLRKQGHLLQYVSPVLDGFDPKYKSDPEGYWATYYINLGPMMYDPRHVDEDTAPKTWLDLLDPRWNGQIGFQNASAGSQYGWWYLLKDVLPADYWDKLAAQKPRAYSSSTQIINAIHRGDLKIGGKVSSFQYLKSLRQDLPIRVVYPSIGTPAQNQVAGIIGATKRPNAAKAYVDFLLSQEGQKIWNDMQGSFSARGDVEIEGLPNISTINVLVVKDLEDYGLPANHADFVDLWNNVTGF